MFSSLLDGHDICLSFAAEACSSGRQHLVFHLVSSFLELPVWLVTQLCLLTTNKNLPNSDLSPCTGRCHGNRVINNHRLMCCVVMKCVYFHMCRPSQHAGFSGLESVERGMSRSHKDERKYEKLEKFCCSVLACRIAPSPILLLWLSNITPLTAKLPSHYWHTKQQSLTNMF